MKQHKADSQAIVLIGFMGSGKTTIAQKLAERLGFECVDLDAEIVAAAGRSISDIFRCDGEATFRNMETLALRSITGRRRLVVATGGGIVERQENWGLLRETGLVIHLACAWSTLRKRLEHGTDRPLANARDDGWARVEELYRKRLPLYAQADIEVQTDIGSPDVTVNEIVKLLESESNELSH
jgi:shikimate kinase